MEEKLQEFIDNNRAELDRCIRSALDRPNFDLDDDERENWVLNDEGLYRWARAEGALEE
jgi:hypothetical protein